MSRPQHHSRRSFLTGRAVADALAGSAESLVHDDQPELATRQSLLMRVSRRAMACDFVVQVPARPDDAAHRALAALDLIESLEDQMTVYRDDSEVVRINRDAATGPVPVEPRLFRLLQLAQQIYRDTGGASDPTSGPLSQVWGFSRRAGRLPAADELRTARQRMGFGHVRLNAQAQTIAFDRPGIEINLNSIGKGYALDRAAELLMQAGVSDFLFHGGRSSVLARGGPDEETRDWIVGVRHPLWPESRIGELRLRDEALATSGAATQSFRHRGKRYGHILDPRTGWPANGTYTATVLAPTAAEADALSTAFYVMGPDEVARYCAARPAVRAVVLGTDAPEGEVAVRTFNLHEDTWQAAR